MGGEGEHLLYRVGERKSDVIPYDRKGKRQRQTIFVEGKRKRPEDIVRRKEDQSRILRGKVSGCRPITGQGHLRDKEDLKHGFVGVLLIIQVSEDHIKKLLTKVMKKVAILSQRT